MEILNTDCCCMIFFKCVTISYNYYPTEKEQQEAIEHIDEVQNEIDR